MHLAIMFLEHQPGSTNVVEVGELVLVHKLDTESIHSLPLMGVAVQSSLGSLGSPGTCLSPRTPQVLVCPLLHMLGLDPLQDCLHVCWCLGAHDQSLSYKNYYLVNCL